MSSVIIPIYMHARGVEIFDSLKFVTFLIYAPCDMSKRNLASAHALKVEISYLYRQKD